MARDQTTQITAAGHAHQSTDAANETAPPGRLIPGRRAGQRFDAAFNVTTEALIFLGELDPEAIGPGIAFATHYEPTPIADFDAFVKAVPADFDLRSAAFVDIGSGMGRAVFLAAQHPFRQVIGVEISPALHEIARENLANYRCAKMRCHDVRLICADAATFVLPRSDVLLYLYNPFRAPMVRAFVAKVLARSQADLLLFYHTPVERGSIESHDALETIAELPFGVLYRKRRAKLAKEG